MEYKITVLPGDGIGPEVIDESVKVLEAVGRRFGHDFDLAYGIVGGGAIDATGSALPDETIEMCLNSDAVLFGAVGGPKWDDPQAKVRPEDGILAIRKQLGLFANLRPVKVYPTLINASPVKPELLEGVDMIVVRELTGGLYFAQPKKRWNTSRGRRSVDTLKYTEKEILRILRVGFELARGRRKLLTSVDKANVLESSRLWREIAVEVSADYPDVELEHILVDAAAMQLISNPSHYDVIVAENMFGDIISDEASVIGGSIGLLASASIGDKYAMFEPIHGSYTQAKGKGIANPIASILSVAMLLDHFELNDEAELIRNAVEKSLKLQVTTPDLNTKYDNISTSKVGDFIEDVINNPNDSNLNFTNIHLGQSTII